MLTSLAIDNFAVIDHVELEFSSGLCVLTGETGAGKSLLVDALNLISGQRLNADCIRPNRKETEISAVFDIEKKPNILKILSANSLDSEDGTLLVRRVLNQESRRSKNFVNGRLVTLKQLIECVSPLIDICGQHENFSLLERLKQQSIVDTWSNSNEIAEQVKNTYFSWKKQVDYLAQIEAEFDTSDQLQKSLKEDIDEIKKLGCDEKKWKFMNATHTRLLQHDALTQNCGRLISLLGDDNSVVIDGLSESRRLASDTADTDPAFTSILENLKNAEMLIDDAIRDIMKYADSIVTDEHNKQEVEEFMSEAYRLARKFNLLSPDELPILLGKKSEQLSKIKSQENIDQARTYLAELKTLLDTYTTELSQLRIKHADEFSKKITKKLKKLSMLDANFIVHLEHLDAPTAHGREKIRFLLSTKKEHKGHLIGKIASGGELSRIALAIHVTMGGISGAPTMVFDEIDAGVGGGVGEIIGTLLYDLGKTRQVFCVTHLPQIAVQASEHWVVQKKSDGNITVNKLCDAGCLDEISRMLSGTEITDTARAHAAEMLSKNKNTSNRQDTVT